METMVKRLVLKFFDYLDSHFHTKICQYLRLKCIDTFHLIKYYMSMMWVAMEILRLNSKSENFFFENYMHYESKMIPLYSLIGVYSGWVGFGS